MDFYEILTNGEVYQPCNTAIGSDVRIMTTNVLASRWGEDLSKEHALKIPPFTIRAEILKRTLEAYLPDVIGIQETDKKWLDGFPNYLHEIKDDCKVSYEWVHKNMGDKMNLTSLLFRSDKLYIWDAGYEITDYWKDPKLEFCHKEYCSRGVFWAFFERKDAPGKCFIVVNTHWTPNTKTVEEDRTRDIDVKLQIECVNTLLKKYNVPIFCTGDFNTALGMPLIERFEKETQSQALYDIAQREHVDCSIKYGGLGAVGKPHDTTITYDHIFGVGKFDLLRYEALTEGNHIWLSDHLPHVADIKL